MASRTQNAQEKLAKLAEIAEQPPAAAPAKPPPGKPITLRPAPELWTWCVHEAARQSIEAGKPVTVQDVILKAVEALRASRG